MIATAKRRAVFAIFAAAALLVSSCGTGRVMRGRIDGLNGVVRKAEQNGAMRCAPRELALAKSHLRFAATDLDQGSAADAEKHLAIAEPNAQAALSLSPIEKCSSDRDGDGIADAVDRCPDIRENYNGFEDLDGCPDDPDTDKDGIPDSRDACLLEPEDKDGYLDDDGCPDLDNDADGIPDATDKCPDQAEDPDGVEDEDGCPDDDNDKDTVPDVADECPNTAGQPGGAGPGCPNLIIVTAKEIRITQQIQFDFNKATIKPVSFPILDAVKDVLAANPKIAIEVQGHTDNVGQGPYNMKLSQERASAVRAYLTGHGIDGSRLVSKGFGMSQPLVANDTEANRGRNRRVQFLRTESQTP